MSKNKKMPPFKVIVESISEKGGRVRFKNVRCAFVKLATPGKAMTEGDDPKYETTLLIPKKSGVEFKKLQKALDEVVGSAAKFKNAKDKAAALKLVRAIHKHSSVIKDGDKTVDKSGKIYDGLEGHHLIKASTHSEKKPDGTYKPKQGLILRYRTNEDIPQEDLANQLYSGAWYDIVVFFSPYVYMGKKAVTCYLQGVMKLANDTRLGGLDPFSEGRDDIEDDEEDYDDASGM